MSGAVRKVASIALPIIGTVVAPGIGTYFGSTLSTTALSAIGGAVGGAAGTKLSGGNMLTGGLLGGTGGYIYGSGGIGNAVNNVSDILTGSTPDITSTIGSSSVGNNLLTDISSSGVSGVSNPSTFDGLNAIDYSSMNPSDILTAGVPMESAGMGTTISNLLDKSQAIQPLASLVSAGVQYDSTQDALKLTKPYTAAGQEALNQYTKLTSDPAAANEYIQNNTMYNALADEAKRTLMATKASTGKLASGGTAAALQDKLTTLGADLLNQHLGQLQNTINTGYGATSTAADLTTQGGNAIASGVTGAANSYTSNNQNYINTLLAMQNLKNAASTPTYKTTSLKI